MMRTSKFVSAIGPSASFATRLNVTQIRHVVTVIGGNVMSRIVSRLAAIAVFLIAQAGLVNGAEVKVFSTIGVQTALEELAPKFEQATGNKLNLTWATAAILAK